MTTAVAVLGYQRLADVVAQYSSLDPKGAYLEIAKILHRACPLVDILPMVKSNQLMSHVASRETYLPSPGARRFNEYISPTAGHTKPLTEGISMFEDYSEVDKALYDIQPEPAKWRQDRDQQHIEGFRQKIESGLFYGSTAADGQDILGFAARFKNLATYPNNDSAWKYNVLGGGGTGSALTSIWVFEFGLNKVYATYPANLLAGLYAKDLGEQTAQTSSGLMQVLRTHFRWCIGMMIEDERCVQRYANIATTAGANTFDESILIDLIGRLPGAGNAPGTVIVCNRTINTQINIRATVAKTNAYYTQDEAGDIFGRRVTRFQGIPILTAEKLLDTETEITTGT
jgi:hypothetical protein